MSGVMNSREVKEHSGRTTENRLYTQGDVPVSITEKIGAQWQTIISLSARKSNEDTNVLYHKSCPRAIRTYVPIW